MCEPTTTTLLYMSLASTAVSMGGMMMQAQNAKKTAKYNAKLNQIEQADLKNRAVAEEEKVRRKGAQMKAEQMAISALNKSSWLLNFNWCSGK